MFAGNCWPPADECNKTRTAKKVEKEESKYIGGR
jgi:hypothetical protein